jgi:RNA polymerase sigma factor (sigma-70 family)
VSLALTSAIPLQAERSSDLDAATVEGCRAGDPPAIEAFIARYQNVVFAFLSRTIGPGPRVEDLAQEVFLRACRALPRFEPEGAARLSTWLLTIASHVAIDARRKRHVPVRPIDIGREIAHPDTPETERRRAEIGRAIAEAAVQLPDEQLDAFVLAELHGLEMKEIGRVLGIPENTAKTRIHRARERLRVLLKEVWEEL